MINYSFILVCVETVLLNISTDDSGQPLKPCKTRRKNYGLFHNIFHLISTCFQLQSVGGMDFQALTADLTFGNNLTTPQNPLLANASDPRTQMCLLVSILNDTIPEMTETLQLRIDEKRSDESVVDLIPDRATIFIMDDDGKKEKLIQCHHATRCVTKS